MTKRASRNIVLIYDYKIRRIAYDDVQDSPYSVQMMKWEEYVHCLLSSSNMRRNSGPGKGMNIINCNIFL
jgi:hypothetical protein